jgi:hypothetical protein
MLKTQYELDYEEVLANRHKGHCAEAAANSLNVLVPFTIYPCLHWSRNARDSLHYTVRQELQIFIMLNREKLLYNKEVHKDVDVLSYYINRSDKSKSEKDALLSANMVRIFQDREEVAVLMRKRLPGYCKVGLIPVDQQVTIDARISDKTVEQPRDLMRTVCVGIEKMLMPVGPSMLLIKNAEELEETEIMDIHREDGWAYDQEVLVKSLDFVEDDSIVFLDTEYRSYREGEAFKKDYFEVAIIDNTGDILYHQTKYGVINGQEVLDAVRSKIVLVKGVAAEIEYLMRLEEEFCVDLIKRQELRNSKNRKLSCMMYDLNLFGIPKYPHRNHESLKEIMFFRDKFNDLRIEIRQKYESIIDPYVRRRLDILMYRLLYSMANKNIDGVDAPLSDYHSSLLYYGDTLGPINKFYYCNVTATDYQVVLWKTYYETSIYFPDLPCYFHNNRKCRQCSYRRLKLDWNQQEFKNIMPVFERWMTLYNVRYGLWIGSAYYDMMPTLNRPDSMENFREFVRSIDFEKEWEVFLKMNEANYITASQAVTDFS